MKMLMARTLGLAAAAGACAWAAHAADGPLETVKVKAVVQFEFDRAALDAADQALILVDVGRMKDVTWQTITAVGHTDAIGTPAYNDALAARRAAAVKGYLVGKGLPPVMIRTAAEGEAQPVADNDSADGRARNRRTEIEFEGVRPSAK